MAITQGQRQSIQGIVDSFKPINTDAKRQSVISTIKSFGADPAEFGFGATIPITSSTTSTQTPEQIESQRIAKEREAKRQGFLQQAQALQSGGGGSVELQDFINTVPAEFKGDVSSFLGVSGTGATTTPSGFQLDQDTKNQIIDTRTEEDENLDNILASSNLSQDMKDMVKFMFDAQQTFNTDTAQSLLDGIEFASGQANPIFKAQLSLARDALQRGFVSEDKALEFKEQQLAKTLNDLRQDTASSKEFLNFEEAQTLKNLEKDFELNLENTRQGLAQTGKTSSSVRSKAEQMLGEEKEGLVESAERKFGFQQEQLGTKLARTERDTVSDLTRLREITASGKLDLFRKGEELVGTSNLPNLGGLVPLGGQVGSLEQKRAKDITSTLSSFVF